MPALREIFASFGIEFDRAGNLRRGNRQVSATVRTLQRVGPAAARAARGIAMVGAAAGTAAAAGLARMVSSTVEAEREINRWSGRLSINRDELRSWIGIGQEYGATVDDVTDALKEMQLKATDAIAGGTEQAEMFERIGISINDLRPVVNDADALMGLFVDRLEDVESQALRNFTVDEIMSDAGTRLNEVFALGSDEIQRRRDELEASVGSTERLSRVIATHTRWVIGMRRRWAAFGRDLTLRVLPLIQQAEGYLRDWQEPIRDLIRNTDILKGAVFGLGVVAAAVAALTITTWGPIVGTVIAVAAAVAGLAVAYDQVTRTIRGGNTALREFLDDSDRLGEGGTTGVVLLLGDAWDRLTRRIGIAVDWLGDMYETLRPIIEAIDWITQGLRYMGGGFLVDAGRGALGMLRESAQERNQEEEQRQETRRRRRNERISEAETSDIEAGSSRDYFGQRISVPGRGGFQDLPMSRPSRREQRTTNVDAPMNVDIQVNEATDAEETQRRITSAIERAQQRQIRDIESMIEEAAT